MRDKKKVLAVVALAVCLAWSSRILAHHGTRVSYDRAAQVTLKGVVTGFKYTNPHCALFMNVTDEDGKVTHWAFELAQNPYSLALRGWSKKRSEEAVRSGTVVTVTVSPSRAGTPVGLLERIVNEEGVELFGANLAGGAAPARE